jgi:cyclopropane fatty-acyl-phospholipid synthase-like methyltransferase
MIKRRLFSVALMPGAQVCWEENFRRAWPWFADRYGKRFRQMWRFYLLRYAGAFRGAQLAGLFDSLFERSYRHWK